MRKADRLLQIVQILRRSAGIVTAQQLAEELEVNIRTIYRDMVAVEAMGAPVRGEAGVGYILEDGYDLPPMMFTQDELETIMLGMRFVDGRGDEALRQSAQDVLAKIKAILPKELRDNFGASPLIAPKLSPVIKNSVNLKPLREAIRKEKIVKLLYQDAVENKTERIVYPILIGFFEEVKILIAYCTLREAFRWFRVDRIAHFEVFEQRYPISSRKLLMDWKAQIGKDDAKLISVNQLRGLR